MEKDLKFLFNKIENLKDLTVVTAITKFLIQTQSTTIQTRAQLYC